ncbi:MAG TPA: TonB-dependent receptor [Steroidobacteraceae bacterium]|jgi:outer membrane receptor protein involved in Fe transport|nr:TonB-dependent receptor [Steroidobacteraceae bacterium]
MINTGSRCGGAKAAVTQRRVLTTVGAAVCIALYGAALPVRADDAGPAPQGAAAVAADDSNSGAPTLQEITVTASRRTQTEESVPYSLTVITPQQLDNANVTDISSLTSQVPGLSMYDFGARFAGATVPIIRGINATGEPRGFRSFEQSPVGVYVDNSPMDDYIGLIDLQRIEVLRGPQGTLYGAGSLGGAIRLIPNDPELNTVSGQVEAGGDRIANSSGNGYTVDGVLNLPLGHEMALRVAAKYDSQPGWIDVYGLMARSGTGVSAIPKLADPSDPVDSSGIYSNRSDWNFQKTFTGRASLLWQPVESFKAVLALLHTGLRGDGGPQVNRDFPGGPSPIDPNEIMPAGGPYQEFSQVDQPFSRYTNLTSLDLSYDVGFATLSSTSSYRTTTGQFLEDDTYNIGGVDGGAYLPYYAGQPVNPRFVYDYQFNDSEHTFSQEVRLVSKTPLWHRLDYVVGAYYEDQTRQGAWNIANPGTPERSIDQGCAECLVTAGPGDLDFTQIDTQHFQDKSVYGDLTWHLAEHLSLSGGVRHFQQEFTDAQLYLDYTFPTLVPATPHNAPASTNIGKADLSYEYAHDQYVYVLWSQGFRRGGANSVPLVGPFKESAQLASYAPDSTNNYEAGLKGRFANGLSYSFDLFDVKWNKPQISASLPSGNLAVYNGNTAESKGFELQTMGPLFLPGLAYNVGVSYADAKLTSNFALPANDGTGVIVPGLISGKSGDQLPGSPKTSITAALDYQRLLMPGYSLALSLNGTYHGVVKLGLAQAEGNTPVQQSSSYLILNASAALSHDPWRATLYITNLANKEEILVPPYNPNAFDDLTNDYIVNEPRMIGVRLAYMF